MAAGDSLRMVREGIGLQEIVVLTNGMDNFREIPKSIADDGSLRRQPGDDRRVPGRVQPHRGVRGAPLAAQQPHHSMVHSNGSCTPARFSVSPRASMGVVFMTADERRWPALVFGLRLVAIKLLLGLILDAVIHLLLAILVLSRENRTQRRACDGCRLARG